MAKYGVCRIVIVMSRFVDVTVALSCQLVDLWSLPACGCHLNTIHAMEMRSLAMNTTFSQTWCWRVIPEAIVKNPSRNDVLLLLPSRPPVGTKKNKKPQLGRRSEFAAVYNGSGWGL